MNLQDIGAVIGIVVASSGVLGGAGKYYLDTEYVAQSELDQFFIQRDIKDFNRQLRKLERIPETDRTDRENWEIEGLEDHIEDLTNDLKAITG